jgi:hypothetical protein
MPKIKEIELDYHEEPCQGKILCIKIKTNKGLRSDFVELPQEATIEDAITAANMLLAGCKDMTY